jgi:hypothetical protein
MVCYYWLQVGPLTNLTMTECVCMHTTTFAGGWSAVPNKIDFSYVFAHADFLSNITIYVTLIVTYCFYIVAMIIARWFDARDRNKVRMYNVVYRWQKTTFCSLQIHAKC